jgi:hypothetical protein
MGETKMSMKRLLAAILSLSILSSSLIAHAATAPQPSGASGLSISPLRQELTLPPGKADKLDVTLKNITGVSIVAKVSIQDFQSDNVSGIPKIITNPKVQVPNGIQKFLINPSDVALAVGQQKTISIPVQTPAGTAPGAYYGLLAYQAVPANANTPGGQNKVALSAAVSQLVFITVPGNIQDRMQLNAIHVYSDKDGNNEGVLFTKPPKALGIELTNLGNGFAKPFGHVSIKSTGGKEVQAYEMNGGIVRSIVLPNSKRIFKNDLKNITRPGRYTVTASLSYGSGSAILTGKKTYWYIPGAYIIALLAIIVLIVIGVLLARRRYRRDTGSRIRS